MKKITTLFASIVLVLAMAGCASTPSSSKAKLDLNVPALEAVNTMPDFLAGASSETVAAVKLSNELIEDAKYASALSALGNIPEEDWDIDFYYSTCIHTDWFCFSLMHTMFSIQNFNSVDELYEYRHNISYGNMDMDFSLTFQQPIPDQAAELIAQHGESYYVDLALAHFYADVARRYGNNWTMSYEDLLETAFDYYSNAISAGVYDKASLSDFGLLSMYYGDFETAIYCFDILTQNFPENGSYWYNLGSSYMAGAYFQEAAYCAKYAILNPEADEEYQADAYVLLSEASKAFGDLETAENALVAGCDEYPSQYRIHGAAGKFYLTAGNLKKAQEYYEKEFLLNYILEAEHPLDIYTNRIDDYLYADSMEGAIAYSENLCNLYLGSEDFDVYCAAYIHYFEAQVYAIYGQKADANKQLDLSKAMFRSIQMDGADEMIEDARSQMGLR